MSAVAGTDRDRQMSALVRVFADGAVVAKRNLIKIKRVPDILVWTLMSPIMFVLLFGLVFGSSIHIPGVSYREFLIAGIFAQTVIFGSTFTGVGLADDMTKGVIDRFRSLPMARSAVLIGRTGSDIVYNSISILVMSLAGLAVGWRIRTGPLRVFADWNPISAVAQAAREAFGNTGNLPKPTVWSLAHPVVYTLIWVAIILAVFVPLSIRQFNKAASRAVA
jgi:ABC-2 type transport system permease protein